MRKLLCAAAGMLLAALPAKADMYPDASNATKNAAGNIAREAAAGGVRTANPTFDDFGARGDGVADDKLAVQTALTASAGGTIYGVGGRTYRISNEVVIPANTTVDCAGATFLLTDTSVGPRMFRLGNQSANSSNIEIRNCRIETSLTATATGITPYAGTSNIRILNNTFLDRASHNMKAISIRAARVSEVYISGNRFIDVFQGVFVDGDETQTWVSCYGVPSGSSCAAAGPPPAATTTFTVPAASQAEIAAGYGYGVVIEEGSNTRRLYGPNEFRSDYTYNPATGVMTFAVALPTTAERVRFFTWDRTKSPANDLYGLRITHNHGSGFRDAAVQINCPTHSLNIRTAYQDCQRNVVVSSNVFAMPAQLDNGSVGGGGNIINLFRWSQDFTNDFWVKTRSSVADTTYLSPPYMYDQTAQKLAEDSSPSTSHFIQQDKNIDVGVPYVVAYSMKAAGRYKAKMYLRGLIAGSATEGGNVDVDMSNCTVGTPVVNGGGSALAAGVQSQGNGWCRFWLTAVMGASTQARAQVFLEDASGNITYSGDGASGILLWGASLNTGTTPSVYYPSTDTNAHVANAAMIAFNGVSNCVISDNALGPTLGQAVHLEDWVNNCVISGNTIRDPGGAAIYLTASQGIVVENNNIFNPHDTCLTLAYQSTVDPKNVIDTMLQNYNTTIVGNKCDGYNNPSITEAYRLGYVLGDWLLTWRDNTIVNLPSGAVPILWDNNSDLLLATPDFPVLITVARLGSCTAAKVGQRRYVSDALAPAFGATLVGGGAVPAVAVCDGVSAWKAH